MTHPLPTQLLSAALLVFRVHTLGCEGPPGNLGWRWGAAVAWAGNRKLQENGGGREDLV